MLLVVAGAATWLAGAGLLVTGAPAWPGLALLIGGFAVAMTGIVGLKGAAEAVARSLVEGGSPR